ncbi:putative receptor-like protein kinase At4g00960 isoform X2 [Triticum dicoccoides]|uniref:putative receptor-like protein kinase At4g00960 isoform X2 n=1 Tax=Triticum dicoccoides TaxID=85692 RepID=UPI000E7A09D2|nr:putative receptor-like protein kinase At4g00960 isoform X2 [Triticum dicoccoides]
MDRAITLQNELESMLTDESAEPKRIALSLLEIITNGFSDDEIIGNGGFARVYKGMLRNGMIAVKKLLVTIDIDENKFIEEVRCLMNAKHKNIVRFLGYCSESQGEMLNFNGKLVLADLWQRVLCFEYISEGSLEKKINDASCGLEWSKRYEIINGICDGLYYLHQNRIVHLDLKPANILLDRNMMPKIADFGLSRRLCEGQSKIITSNFTGTMGYIAPEYWCGQIALKCDLYSLGIIIIEILTGAKGCPNIDDVLNSWRNRLEKTERETQLVQLRACAEIAIECTAYNPAERPDIVRIIDRLRATKSTEESAASSHKGQESL